MGRFVVAQRVGCGRIKFFVSFKKIAIFILKRDVNLHPLTIFVHNYKAFCDRFVISYKFKLTNFGAIA